MDEMMLYHYFDSKIGPFRNLSDLTDEEAVLPKRQGLGIGKQLLNAVKDYSKNNGLAGIVLYTSEYAPAAKFYEKNGFELSNGTICMYCE